MRTTFPWVVGLAALVVAVGSIGGCGDSSGGTDSGPPMDGGDGDDGGGDDGGPPDNGVAYDDIFDGSCSSAPDCENGQTNTACACPTTPRSEAELATNRVGCSQLSTEGDIPRTPEDDYCDADAADGSPDLSCFMEGMYREAGESQMVTLYGVVDVFGNGGDADQITVEVFEDTGDGSLGDMIGSATASIDSPCAEEDKVVEDGMVVQTRQIGFYTIADVPTETPLVIKTSGNAEFWRSLYTYNIQIFNDEVETGDPPSDACGDMPSGPRAEYEANILSSSDWETIPLTAGLTSGISSGNGAVAGEVHDCSDTRLEFAQVATNPRAEVLTYFNDNPTNPLPQTTRTFEGTSLLGLYAALDIEPGPVDVAALGRVDGELVSLGWYRAQVFEGAITVVTFRGLRAQQTP